MSDQPKPSENGNEEEHFRKLEEERRRMMEAIRRDVEIFRAIVKGKPPPKPVS